MGGIGSWNQDLAHASVLVLMSETHALCTQRPYTLRSTSPRLPALSPNHAHPVLLGPCLHKHFRPQGLCPGRSPHPRTAARLAPHFLPVVRCKRHLLRRGSLGRLIGREPSLLFRFLFLVSAEPLGCGSLLASLTRP